MKESHYNILMIIESILRHDEYKSLSVAFLDYAFQDLFNKKFLISFFLLIIKMYVCKSSILINQKYKMILF